MTFGQLMEYNRNTFINVNTFLDGKAFKEVSRDAIWWTLRTPGTEEWLVNIVESMYRNSLSRTRVNGTFSDNFLVLVGFIKTMC